MNSFATTNRTVSTDHSKFLRHRGRNSLILGSVLALAVAGAPSAFASSSTTALMGNDGSLTSTTTTQESSSCPSGTLMSGARVSYETSRGNYTNGITPFCRDSTGAITLAAAITALPQNVTSASADITCHAGDVAVGLYGQAGEVADGIGIECATAIGTTYDAGVAGGTGGSPIAPTLCPGGGAMNGVTAYVGDYYGSGDIFGIYGNCEQVLNLQGVQSPIKADGTSVFALGRTVPVKFTVTDGTGQVVTTLAPTLDVAPVTDGVAGSYVPAGTNVQNGSASTFRYDPTSQSYIFNWATTGLTAGTYSLRISVASATAVVLPAQTETVQVTLQ